MRVSTMASQRGSGFKAMLLRSLKINWGFLLPSGDNVKPWCMGHLHSKEPETTAS